MPSLRPRLALLFLALLLTAGCFGARETPWTRHRAEEDAAPRSLRIDRVRPAREVVDGGDPKISHYIDVTVLAGAGSGERLLLPYDEWGVNQPPPAPGSEVIASPQDWVRFRSRLPR